MGYLWDRVEEHERRAGHQTLIFFPSVTTTVMMVVPPVYGGCAGPIKLFFSRNQPAHFAGKYENGARAHQTHVEFGIGSGIEP